MENKFNLTREQNVFIAKRNIADYIDKNSFINEYVVRAVTSFLIRKYTKEEYYLKDVENNKKSGFIYAEELVKLLNKKDMRLYNENR